MKKITTSYSTMRTLVLPLLSVGLLAGVAEAASSGVRVHRIGDPPLLPRSFVQTTAPATHKTQAAPQREVRRTGQAVPMAPVGQEVSSAPVSAIQAPATAPKRHTDSVPLAPQPKNTTYQGGSYTPASAPASPTVVPVRRSSLPLAPTTYVTTTPAQVPVAKAKPRATAPSAPAPKRTGRRLPIAPVD